MTSADNAELKQGTRRLILDLRQMKTFCERPLVIERGEGVYVYDVDGNRYIDGVSGIFVVTVGHGHPHVIEAVRRQHERIAFVAPLHAVSDTAVRYAKKLAGIAPEGMNTVKLMSGGSEATESAIKFSRQYHRQTGNPLKYKVIANYTGYHGATMGAMAASGLGGPRKSKFGPFLEGFLHLPPPKRYTQASGHAWDDLCTAGLLEEVIRYEGPESIAAYILEPISNTGGILTPSPAYFERVREICDRYRVHLIYDEIITGMGRTGEWFAAQTFGVAPDILCAGKGLSSGYAPLSAMIVRDDLYFEGFWGEAEEEVHFAHGHTYGANPVSAAAGLAVIEVVEGEDLIARGRETGRHIRERLAAEVARLGILGEVRGKGALTGVAFVRDMATMEPFSEERQFGKRVERRLLDAGLILRCDPHWIGIAPPLCMTPDQADEMVEVLVRCLQDEAKETGK